MNSRFDRKPPRGATSPPPPRIDPISDNRFQDLLSRASAFFAEAERDVEGERAQAIADIRQTMQQYGLTVEDLQ